MLHYEKIASSTTESNGLLLNESTIIQIAILLLVNIINAHAIYCIEVTYKIARSVLTVVNKNINQNCECGHVKLFI